MNKQKNVITRRIHMDGWIAHEKRTLDRPSNKQNHATEWTNTPVRRSAVHSCHRVIHDRHCWIGSACSEDRKKNVTNKRASICNMHCCDVKPYSAIGIVTEPRAGRLRIRGSFAGRGKTFFSLVQSVQTGCAAHPVSYTISTRSSFPGGKVAAP
jgi:hypothetical protein